MSSLLEPVDISLDGLRWSEHLDRLKTEIVINIKDNLGEEWCRVTKTIILILVQIL